LGALKCAIYAFDNIDVKINDFAEIAALAPAEPKTGAANAVATNCPPGAYAPVKYRTAIPNVVYNIPTIPISEKGANEAKFFIKHNGSITIPVTPINDCVRVAAIPTDANKVLIVSANIMEYDKLPNQQSKKQLNAIINDVDLPTVASQASEYDIVFVD